MKLIAKRGLFNGPNKKKENTLEQIKLAISKGYDVEVDAWNTPKGWFLGHDEPVTPVDVRFFDNPKIWTHCKTRGAYDRLISSVFVKAFCHEDEDFTWINGNNFKWQHGRLGKFVYEKTSAGWRKIGIYADDFRFKHVFLDFDGCLSKDKMYDSDGKCIAKSVKDTSWTAIKRMKSAGLNVYVLSGDKWNKGICESRNIPFIKSDTLGSNDKLNNIVKLVGKEIDKSIVLVDDYYDLPITRHGLAYCPNDAIDEVKLECQILRSDSGGNVVSDLYEDLIKKGIVDRVAPTEG